MEPIELTSKQKTDIAMLERCIELIKNGGILTIVHVSKSEDAHAKFLKDQEKVYRSIAENRRMADRMRKRKKGAGS